MNSRWSLFLEIVSNFEERGEGIMRRLKNFFVLGMTFIILFILNCQMQTPSESEQTTRVTLKLKIAEDDPSGNMLWGLKRSEAADVIQQTNKTNVAQIVDEVRAVFYQLSIDFETLNQNYENNWEEVEAYMNNFQGDETDFEAYWVTRDQGEINIASEGQYEIEKRGNLSVSRSQARGEFELTEGLKACRVGCFENGRLTYVGRSEGLEGTGFFDIIVGENTEITVTLYPVETSQP
jgi:hypothetical protein